jgi:tetratricopeptide (TPR) repeat protein
MTVVRQPDGEIRIVKMYVYLAAETMAKILRRAFLAAVASESRTLLERLQGKESDFVKHIAETQAMTAAVQNGQPQRAIAIYRKLPLSLQKDKSLLLIRYRAAAELQDDEYTKAMDDFRKYHPDDPCIDIICVDAHFQDGEFDEALACVDRLDEAVGGDPYLELIRANVCIQDEDYDGARKLAHKALEAEEDLIDAQWCLITISLAEKDFDETSRLLTKLAEEFGMEFDDLTQVPEYAEYVKSPQYRQWLESQR